MIHAYDNPNICYAIGDSFGVYMGTGSVTRQPSSGVFEEVSSVLRQAGTDSLGVTDGSAGLDFFEAGIKTGIIRGASTGTQMQAYNMGLKIGNTVYLEKGGTTDRVHITGVQVDA